MRIIDRLDKYIEIKEINDNQITVNCNLSQGLLSKARQNGEIGKKSIEKILNFYQDLNKVWLLTGDGEMLKGDITIKNVNPIDLFKAGTEAFTQQIATMMNEKRIAPYEWLADKDEQIAKLNREIGRLEALLDNAKKMNAQEVDDAGCADAK